MKPNGKEKYYLAGYKHHPLSLARRIESFRHAFRGLFDVLHTEPNAWVHSISTVLVLAMAFWLEIRSTPFCFLLLAIVAVWITEIFNTVLEIVVDIASPEYSDMAKRAKDIAASAVLIAAMGAVALGIVIFTPAIQKRFTQEVHAKKVVVMNTASSQMANR